MEIQRLFDRIEIDFERLKGPFVERDESRSADGSGPGARLSLENARTEHLCSGGSLRYLYRQAVTRGLVADSEGGLIAFCSTAAFCVRVGRRPAALFVYLIKRGLSPATLADEDQACSVLKRHIAAQRKNLAWLKVK